MESVQCQLGEVQYGRTYMCWLISQNVGVVHYDRYQIRINNVERLEIWLKTETVGLCFILHKFDESSVSKIFHSFAKTSIGHQFVKYFLKFVCCLFSHHSGPEHARYTVVF